MKPEHNRQYNHPYSIFQLEGDLANFEQADIILPVQVHQKVDITVRTLFHP